MKSSRTLGFALLFGAAGLVAACGGEEPVAGKPAAPAVATPAQAQPRTPAPPAEKYIAGQVQQIDTDARTLVLKDTKGVEQTFSFSDTTSITGAANLKNLSTQEGRPATIRYIDQGSGKSAIQIHIEAGS